MTFLDSQRTTPPPRLAVDAKGYVWRCYGDGHWSMAPSNPDNSPIPEPITYYLPTTVSPQRIERAAMAMFAVTNPGDEWGGDFPEFIREQYRRLAHAALEGS